MRRGLSVMLFALTAGCAAGSLGPFAFRLQYKTVADPVDFPLMQACAAVSSVEVSDTRRNAELGTRFLERQPQTKYPVTAATDVEPWVRSGVEEGLRRAQVTVGKDTAPILRIAIENIETEESVYRRAEYDGRVALNAELRSRSAQTACWQERIAGAAENYGYAGSRENYLETVNHALDRAVVQMLSNKGFREALCSCTP